jgi:hypothetical protein
MIPDRKKTPEELAALREAFGFIQNLATPTPTPADQPKTPVFEKVIGQAMRPTPPPAPSSPVVRKPKKKRIHSLRRVELPLAPGYKIQNQTQIPKTRHTPEDIAEIRKRETLANLSANALNPIARLEKLTAHPVLLTLTYLTAFLAIYAAWQAVFFITPISLIFVSGLLTAYIFWRKKRSRHHAAILIIILVMTLVFGGIHYAPLFSAYAT